MNELTFFEIFDAKCEVADQTVNVKRIVIPKIQRDYAQGRTDPKTQRVRARFLDSLYSAINYSPIKLDFVYGDVDADGVLTPLDGQQRLTTLFLLHWYAAKRENIPPSEYEFLKNFSYQTRYSARDFCENLVDFDPTFCSKLSDEITDAAWFPLDWKKDATIAAMLVMLDDINDKFKNVDGLWDKLKRGAITFYFLPIREMGLTDELYIKMNSRGKPLTVFEHFKAELEHELKKIDESLAKRIIQKIDREWADLLWKYRDENNLTDELFLRYFRFVCDIICFESGKSTLLRSNDEFELIKKYFSKGAADAQNNILKLEQYFDMWQEFAGDTKSFFEKFISTSHTPEKIQYAGAQDLFRNCLYKYANVSENSALKPRYFTLAEIMRLYAFSIYLLNKDSVTQTQFSRRIRIVHNLLRNSNDEMNESDFRRGGNRIPKMLEVIKTIVIEGKVEFAENTFNIHQLKEEAEKLAWTNAHPELAESLFKLEDHLLLMGQTYIVGLDHFDNFDKFEKLFACNRDAIDCALLAMGNYSQKNKNSYRFGTEKTSSWYSLFHKSNIVENFDRTSEVLNSLLSSLDIFNDEQLKKISDKYISDCEKNELFDWRYYYIKYSQFRPNRYGRYKWIDFEHKPYELIALWAEKKLSEKAFQPFLKVIDKDRMSNDPYDPKLIYPDKQIYCFDDKFLIKTDIGDKPVYIKQTADGIDREDRIIKIKAELNKL